MFSSSTALGEVVIGEKDWKPTVNWAKYGKLRCRSNQNFDRFPLRALSTPWSTMAPWSTMILWYALILWYACGSGVFFLNLESQIPAHIPIQHHTPSCAPKSRTENFGNLNRSKLPKFHGMRSYARLLKTPEKQRFPTYLAHIPYFQIPEHFSQKKHLCRFFFFFWF